MRSGVPRSLVHRIAAVEAAQAAAVTKAGGPVVADLIDPLFPVQQAFLEDTSQMIAALCTRRASKSFSAGKRLVRAMYRHPGCSVLFIALTRESAKKILWKDVLKVINRRWKLEAKFNESELSMSLPNGSVMYLLGVDTNEDEKQKLLGQKYAEVVIDESASYSIDLEELVYGVLKPAVADYRGTICMVGTPGNFKRGLFFDLTQGKDPRTPSRWSMRGWSCHAWSTLDNPYMAENWRAEIAQLIADNPGIEETPAFQQNFWGIWVIDSTKLVYRYERGRNDFNGTLPAYGAGLWHFVLGIDLGFNDATAFTVCAYHDHDRCLYVLTSQKQSGLDITATSQYAATLKAKWPIEETIIDGANKQAVAELNNRHGLEAQAADKTGKADFIDIMNAELIQSRIKLGPDCEPLRDEYANLIWDERQLLKNKRVEHAGCANHCADSTLYDWRHCWQYLSVEQKPKAAKHSVEYLQQQQDETKRLMEEAFEAQFAENRRMENEAREQNDF